MCDPHRIILTMKTRKFAAGVLTAAFLFTMAPAASAAPAGQGSGVAETTGFVKGTKEFFCIHYGVFCD